MKLLTLVFCLASIPGFASTVAMDGNDLLNKCRPLFNDTPGASLTNTEQLNAAYCAGYIAGALDVEAAWTKTEGKFE